jgi:hypothetical protein
MRISRKLWRRCCGYESTARSRSTASFSFRGRGLVQVLVLEKFFHVGQSASMATSQAMAALKRFRLKVTSL